MKITLPNGLVIEGDGVTPEFVLGLVGMSTATPDGEIGAAEAVLSGAQRDTLRAIRCYPAGVSVDTLAEHLEITNQAASQRCRYLIDVGLIARISKGVYQAVEV